MSQVCPLVRPLVCKLSSVELLYLPFFEDKVSMVYISKLPMHSEEQIEVIGLTFLKKWLSLYQIFLRFTLNIAIF